MNSIIWNSSKDKNIMKWRWKMENSEKHLLNYLKFIIFLLTVVTVIYLFNLILFYLSYAALIFFKLIFFQFNLFHQ